jgi:hypothetical protein
MYHKGKRRRRFIAWFAQAEPEASSSDGISELARIAASFEPAHSELYDHKLEVSPDSDERQSSKPAGEQLTGARTVSEASTGEKIFHFGCYPSATRFYLDRKITTPAASNQEAIHLKD